MTKEVSLYTQAKHALAQYRTVDEVKDFRDKAMALRLYAQQAKDRSLEEDAIEARMRAERRLGEMMGEQPKAPSARDMKGNQYTGKLMEVSSQPPPTLASQGIDKNLANRARTLARMSDEQFEATIAKARRLTSTTLEEKKEERQYGTATILRGMLQTLNQMSNPGREERALCRLIADRAQVLSTMNPLEESNIVSLSTTKTSNGRS